MAFWKKKEKEKQYDCATEEGYFEYRKIMYEKYQHTDLDSLKHIKFMVEAKQDKVQSRDHGITVALMISMTTILLNFIIIDKQYSLATLFQNIFSNKYMILVIVCLLCFAYIAYLCGTSKKGTNKEISMLKLEKQVLEELIAEKSKPHKFHNEFF